MRHRAPAVAAAARSVGVPNRAPRVRGRPERPVRGGGSSCSTEVTLLAAAQRLALVAHTRTLRPRVRRVLISAGPPSNPRLCPSGANATDKTRPVWEASGNRSCAPTGRARRCRAAARRNRAGGPPASAARQRPVGCQNPAARRVTLAGQEVVMRAKEFDLLARLAAEPNRAVSRETLMADVWDENWFGSTKTLDVHVAAVRRKLAEAADGTPGRVAAIVTLRGHGYRLETPAARGEG